MRTGAITPIKVKILKKVKGMWKLIRYSNIRHRENKLLWSRFTHTIGRAKPTEKTPYKFWITYTDDKENCNGGVYTDKKEMLIAWNACISNELVLVLWNDLERKKFPLVADYSILDQFVILGSN